MIEISKKLIALGNSMQDLGYSLMPFSFVAYFILRLLECKWNKKYISKLVKSIWYLAVGIGTLGGDVRIEQLVIMMIFFDAFDSFIEYLEEKNNVSKSEPSKMNQH